MLQRNCSLLLLLSAFVTARAATERTLSLHPENPHYFLFRDRPAVLISSGEHYGAVLNLDFDYVKYLDTLKAKNSSITSISSG